MAAARAASRRTESQAEETQQTPQIRWEDSDMESSYANVCNVSSTREEVVLVFGVNQAWNRDQREIVVQLSNRVILSPFAAKRLSLLLSNVLREYESRFGELRVEGTSPTGGETAS